MKRDNGLSRQDEWELSYLIHEALTMKDLMLRVVKMLGIEGMTVEQIHHTLVHEEGMSEGDAYLTYIGAKIIYSARVSA